MSFFRFSDYFWRTGVAKTRETCRCSACDTRSYPPSRAFQPLLSCTVARFLCLRIVLCLRIFLSLRIFWCLRIFLSLRIFRCLRIFLCLIHSPFFVRCSGVFRVSCSTTQNHAKQIPIPLSPGPCCVPQDTLPVSGQHSTTSSFWS